MGRRDSGLVAFLLQVHGPSFNGPGRLAVDAFVGSTWASAIACALPSEHGTVSRSSSVMSDQGFFGIDGLLRSFASGHSTNGIPVILGDVMAELRGTNGDCGCWTRACIMSVSET